MTHADTFLKGNYELLSFVIRNGDAWRDLGYIGRIHYDGAGRMSALGMRRDLPELAAAGQRRGPGGFAYWASVKAFPDEQRVEHHVEGCTTHPEWVGGIQERFYEFDDDGNLKLMVRDDDGQTTGILTWRKL